MYNKLIKRDEKKLDLKEILLLFQDSAVEHGTSMGLSDIEMAKNNHFWGILRTKFRVINNKTVKDVSNITYSKEAGRIDFDREYMIKENDEVLVEGISKWILIDIDKRSLVRRHDLVIKEVGELNLFDKLDKIDFIETDFILKDSYQVTTNDLDKNNHVNNASYANIINKVYNKEVSEFQIDYLNEILNNSLVDIYVYENDYTYVLGKCSGKNCFIAKIKGE